ncbi:GntR family transcriptional regulator [Actinophytocola gossypii]|uniref:GntR family transcriptional regulator n=1 Tax=Actinophytocola gossypii TaxID=2812003 RepID=A0ABT2J209_9PSEU|nr:GntR family transcriptional regulator [Actinophytocola gossypii]MCT2581853.1 GntR family transcriptional regulator [Actinophytocola gossypii]
MQDGLSIKPQRVVSLTDRVFEALEDAIVRCELKPGEVVTDRTLSARLDVSRTPVREALQRLAASGLVTPRDRGTGWEIAGFDEHDLRELFELRKALEPMGLRQLFAGDDADSVRELAGFFDGFDDPIEVADYPRYFQRDNEFHKKIVACTGNSRVIGFYGIVERQIDRGRHFLSTGYKGRIEENLAEHKAVAAAIGRRDVDGAIDALVHHLQRGEELMVEHIKAERAAGRFASDVG